MTSRKVSTESLVARIKTLSRRHRELDKRIDKEQLRTWPDVALLKRLKQERLGLKDAIHLTRSLIIRAGARPPRTI